jgi:hypothetical protein
MPILHVTGLGRNSIRKREYSGNPIRSCRVAAPLAISGERRTRDRTDREGDDLVAPPAAFIRRRANNGRAKS